MAVLDRHLSTLSIVGVRSSILDFLVPMDRPRYVNGIVPIAHLKV